MDDQPTFDRYRPIIPDFQEFLDALARPLPRCVWANPIQTTPAGLEARLDDHGIAYQPVGWRPGTYRLPETTSPGTRFPFVAGLYQVQEEASMLPVELMDLQAGQRILDSCAAPGSKTTQIATTVGPEATVVANDRDFTRMAPLGRALDRLGITNTVATTHDATNLPAAIGTFDRVLADVPCSCEATTRKNPDASPAGAADFARLQTVQQAILKRAMELTRPGGRVVYSTCSYAPEENEAIVDAVLRNVDDTWRPVPARIPGFPASPGLTEWRDQSYDPGLEAALRVYPHHHDTGGFFVAVLEHRGGPDG